MPAPHTKLSSQASPREQGVSSAKVSQAPVPGLHTFSVQALPSSQSFALPTQAPAASQVSCVEHALPSWQPAPTGTVPWLHLAVFTSQASVLHGLPSSQLLVPGVTVRMRLLPLSDTYTTPLAAIARPLGVANLAELGAPSL